MALTPVRVTGKYLSTDGRSTVDPTKLVAVPPVLLPGEQYVYPVPAKLKGDGEFLLPLFADSATPLTYALTETLGGSTRTVSATVPAGASGELKLADLAGYSQPAGATLDGAGELSLATLRAAFDARFARPVAETVRRGRLLDDFSDIGAWALASGTLAQVTGPVGYSMRITTVAGGTSVPQRDFNVDMTGKFLSFEVLVEDANLAQLDILLPSEGRSSNRAWLKQKLLDNSATANAKNYVDGVWKRVTVPMSLVGPSGVTPPTAITDIRQLRLQVVAKAGTVAVVQVRDVRWHVNPLPPGIVWVFDDNRGDTYTTAWPILEAAGFTGTIAVISSTVDTIGASYPYMTLAELQEMSAAGWEMVSHTKTHQQLAGLPLATLQTELRDSYDWLITNGFPKNGAKHFVYPGGSYDAQARREVLRHYRTGRTVIDRNGETPYLSDMGLLTTTYATPTKTLASMKGAADVVAQRGGIGIFTFHSLLSADPGGGRTDWWLTSDFQALVTYVKSLGLPSYHMDDVYPGD